MSTLWDNIPHNHTATSKAAAAQIAPVVGSQGCLVLALIKQNPGVTRDALSRMGVALPSVCARVNALVKLALVREVPGGRTASGRPAHMLYAVDGHAQ